ncbi:hypothetical protein [Guggenheimella bovis]
MKPKFVGLIILIVIIGLVLGYEFFLKDLGKYEVVTGYLGGEKIGLFEDQEFKDLLRKKYKIQFDYKKAGSLDMVHADHKGYSYLFPSSQTALDLYTKEYGKTPKNEIIFNTPIVLYSHKIVADAFVKAGLVTKNGETYYIDMFKLVETIEKGTKWSDIGLPELYGNVSVFTTDPTKSNSGNMFAGLMANVLNGGKVVDQSTIHEVIPKLQNIIKNLGYMESSSADIFLQFLKTGVGAKPVVAGYESQLLEFAIQNPEDWKQLKDDIVIFYPTPTVWSTHIYMALTPDGTKGITALMDQGIQDLAWKKHGFRTGVYSVTTDVNFFNVKGVAPNITKIIQMPDSKTMGQIIDALRP